MPKFPKKLKILAEIADFRRLPALLVCLLKKTNKKFFTTLDTNNLYQDRREQSDR